MDEFEVKNRIAELRSLIASNWTTVEERKRMYKELERLDKTLEIFKEKKE